MAPSTELRNPNDILAGRMTFLAQATLVMFLLLWTSWMYPFDDLLDRRGTPLGADYSMFYVSGQIVLDGSADRLYDQAEHQRRLLALFPGIDRSFCLPYRYPPCVALLMVPLATLPYALSFTCFSFLSCAAWVISVWLLTRHLRILRGSWRQPILWSIAGMPLLWETLLGGQASMFALLILTGTVGLLRGRRFVWAGAVLALAACKPNVLAFVGLGLVLRYPRMLKGLVPVAILLGLISFLPAGWQGWRDYLTLSSQLALQSWDVETPFWKVHGLASWLAMLPAVNPRTCCLFLGFGLSGFVAWSWRTSKAKDAAVGSMALAALVSINALFNPYTPIYDLSLLLVGCLLTAESLVRRHGSSVAGRLAIAQLLLATVYFGPHLSQAVSRTLAVQPFSLALLAILCWQLRQLAAVNRGFQAARVEQKPADGSIRAL